jgi:hypothetical protein
MKHGRTFVVISLVGIAALGLAGCASQPPRGPQRPPGMEKRGFDSRAVINELSLFLPQDLAAALAGGPGGPKSGQASGDQAGTSKDGKQEAPAGLARGEELLLTAGQDGEDRPPPTSPEGQPGSPEGFQGQ